MHGEPEVWGQVWVLGQAERRRASLPWAQSRCGILWNTTPARLRTWGGGFRCLLYSAVEPVTLRPSVGSEGSVSWPGTLWHSAPSVRESYMYWDFTNSKRCKIPAIRRARVCDGIEFSLALSQYSQWRIILHGSRNRHFYVLLIFYLKLNCRYRVINKIHPCLSQKKKKKVWSFPTHGILYFSYHI